MKDGGREGGREGGMERERCFIPTKYISTIQRSRLK